MVAPFEILYPNYISNMVIALHSFKTLFNAIIRLKSRSTQCGDTKCLLTSSRKAKQNK